MPKNFQRQELVYKLQKVFLLEPSIKVDNVKIDEQKKRILIYLTLNGKVSVPQVYKFFMDVLREYGFTNLGLLSELG